MHLELGNLLEKARRDGILMIYLSLREILSIQDAYAVYGRGPAWLTAFLAAETASNDFALFDARFGWMHLPPLCFSPHFLRVEESYSSCCQVLFFTFEHPFLDVDELFFQKPVFEDKGIVLSGALPKWAYARFVREFSLEVPWIALDDPGLGAAVVVFSRVDALSPGDTLPREW